MDTPLLQHDFFSQQSNGIRRAFIFPLLEDSHTLTQARRILLSIALVSKQSYSQMMCPFFLKDVVRLLGEQFKECDISIIKVLSISGMHKYAELNKTMMKFTDIKRFPHAPLSYFSYFMDRGAYTNCTFSDYNVTFVMRAVYINRFDLVHFFARKGADLTAYIHHKKDSQKRKFYYVRDCNMIYHPEKVHACLQAAETEKLRIALKIDKFLETKKAPSLVAVENNYLVNVLTQEMKEEHERGYASALSALYNNDKDTIKKCVPHAIAQVLCQFIELKNSARDNGIA
jgi:hypothetical protein